MAQEKGLISGIFSTQAENYSFFSWLNPALFDLKSPVGRVVNIFGMVIIIFSVGLSMLSTLDTVTEAQRHIIEIIELAVTLIFTAEYFLRLLAAKRPRAYAFSFYGLIDLMTWLPLLFFGDANLAIRLLRLMRLLKLVRYLRAMHLFLSSLQDTIDSLLVVICAIVIIILFSGNLIHTVEPETFQDAFLGSWWALVTMTTVGYGDVVPYTGTGKLIAAGLMLCGITMFAMLTATISVKIAAVLNEGDIENLSGSKISPQNTGCQDCRLTQAKCSLLVCADCNEDVGVEDNYCAACGAQQ